MTYRPTNYETVTNANDVPGLTPTSFQDWNIRARVRRRVSQRGSAELLGSFLGLVVTVLLVWAMIYIPGSITCSNRAELMGVEYSFATFQGCMVKYQGRWLPIEAIRDVGMGGAQ